MKEHRPYHIFENNSIFFLTGRTYGGLPHFIKKGAKEIFKSTLFEKARKFGFCLYAWTLMDNHYHLLLDIDSYGRDGVAGFSPRQEQRALKCATPNCATSQRAAPAIPKFVRELHGATSFKIKKLSFLEVLNEEQIICRGRTPMEDRIEKKLTKIILDWQRAINCATPEGGIANFSSRLSAAKREKIEKLIKLGNLDLAKVLLAFYLPQHFDIPFWYQYVDRVIRNEKDFYGHFNYIHQNCVKHELAKKVGEYDFSSYNDWLRQEGREWMKGVLEQYPVVDFNGKWLE